MPSRLLRLATMVLPILVGVVATTWGLTEYLDATATITPKPPPTYGVLAFSSLNLSVHSIAGWVHTVDVGGDRLDLHLWFRTSVSSPLDQETCSCEHVFGFQAPGQAEISSARAWSGDVEIEILTKRVHVENDTSIVHIGFIPSPGLTELDFDIWFIWTGVLSRLTYWTYSLLIPVATTADNVFTDYFLSRGQPTLIPDFSGRFSLSIHLPEDCEVRGAVPPMTHESVHSLRTDGSYSPIRFYVWDMEFGSVPSPSWGQPMSEVLSVTFESIEGLSRYNRLLFDSGLWIGIGIANIIGGLLEALRYLSGIGRRERHEK